MSVTEIVRKDPFNWNLIGKQFRSSDGSPSISIAIPIRGIFQWNIGIYIII